MLIFIKFISDVWLFFQGSKRIQESQVLPGLAIAILEEALRRSREMSQSEVGAWLLSQFQQSKCLRLLKSSPSEPESWISKPGRQTYIFSSIDFLASSICAASFSSSGNFS